MTATATWPSPFAIRTGVRTGPQPTTMRLGIAALCAGAFFAPYHTWRPLDILFTLSDALFCIAALLLLAAGGFRTRWPIGALTPWWLIAFVLMALGLLIGSVVNGAQLRWAIATAQYGFAFIVLPFLIIGHGRAVTVAIAKAAVAGMVAMQTLGITVYFFFNGTFEENERRFGPDFITGSKRLGAFLADGNWNGCVIAMMLPILGYLYQKKQVTGWVALVAASILLLAGLLAASVTGLTCALVGVVVMVVVGGLRLPRQLILATLAGAAIYVGSGAPLPRAFDARIAPALESGDMLRAGTFAVRYDLVREATAIVENTTVIGLGVDRYREVSELQAPVHNMFLLIWAEGALIALFGWLSMLLILACQSLQALRLDRATGALGLAVLSAFVVASTASPHMYARLWVVPLLVALACIYECARGGRGEER